MWNDIRMMLYDAYALIPSQRLWMTEIISFLAGISSDGCQRRQETRRQHWLPSCRDVHHHRQEASYKSGKTKKRQKYLLLSFFGNNIWPTFSAFCINSIISDICFCIKDDVRTPALGGLSTQQLSNPVTVASVVAPLVCLITSSAYTIFVIFFSTWHIFGYNFSPHKKRVNCDKTDFTVKQRKPLTNWFCNKTG